ncbi:MAG: hypothetical protein KAG61_12360 [Bacteriovoracaceae bacterium]|nr:hypothetical protein [Bacteriovoracaceae bacterium]
MKTNTVKLLAIVLLIVSCNTAQKSSGSWILQFDRSDRPITACLYLSMDSIKSLWISMKCQKSAIDSVVLCTEGRLLRSFSSKVKCNRSFNNAVKSHGAYSLRSDPYEK